MLVTSAMHIAASATVALALKTVKNGEWITLNDGWVHLAKEAMYKTTQGVTSQQWECCGDIAEMAMSIAEKRNVLHWIQDKSQANMDEDEQGYALNR